MSAAEALAGSPLTPSGPGHGDVLARLAPPGAPTAGSDLFEFLRRAELEQYYRNFVDELKVNLPHQVKYCEDEDLMEIGMSRPQIRRLRKFFLRECPQTSLGKLRKVGLIIGPIRERLSRSSSSRTARPCPSRYSPSNEEGLGSDALPGSSSGVSHLIPSSQLELGKVIGEGEFGRVHQGVWRPSHGASVQVAIKVLERLDDAAQADFLKEVTNIQSVEHRNVVRLYGVAKDDDSLKMVTELAGLRSLLECLKESGLRASITVPVLCDFAEQIAEGMRYLESRRLIHRDLAARNILVFSKDRVKISDFGMSTALQLGKEYYQTNYNLNLKLPIAWCAPECINDLRFTSASDVWAYGVTLWEMFSYGFQPWAGLTGEQILATIDSPNFGRLDRPDLCPRVYYDLMQRCWRHEAKERPSFEEVASQIGLLRPDICRCTGDTLAVSGIKDGLSLRQGDSVVVLDKNPKLPDDVEPPEKLWLGVTLGGPGSVGGCGGSVGLFPASAVRLVPQPSAGAPVRSNVLSPSMKTRFNRRVSMLSLFRYQPDESRSEEDGQEQAGGVRRSARGRLRADMISLPQDDFRHTGHIGYDGTTFGDVAFIKQQIEPGDAVRPSIKSSCVSARSVGGSSLSSASSMISLNSGVTSVLGGGGHSHVRFNLSKRTSGSGNSPTDSITTVSDWTGSQSTLTDDGSDVLPFDKPKPKDESDLLSDFSIPQMESSLDFGGLMDDIFKSLTMDDSPASNGTSAAPSSSVSSGLISSHSSHSTSNGAAKMSSLAAATSLATTGRISPNSSESSTQPSTVRSQRTSLLSEMSEDDRTPRCSAITASSTATSFDLILGDSDADQSTNRQPSPSSPARKALQEAESHLARASLLSQMATTPEKATREPSKFVSSSCTSVHSSSSSGSGGSSGSPHQGRKSKLFPSLFSSRKSKNSSSSEKIGPPVISGPISAPIIESQGERYSVSGSGEDEAIYAIPNKPYIRAKTLASGATFVGGTGTGAGSAGSDAAESAARSERKSSISKPTLISAPFAATQAVSGKSSTIAVGGGGDPGGFRGAGGGGTAAFRVGSGSGRRVSGPRSTFVPRSRDVSFSNTGTLSSMSSTLRSLRRNSSAEKRRDDDGEGSVAGLSLEQLGILSSSDTSDSFWGMDLTGAFSTSMKLGDCDDGESCYEELSDQDSTLTRHVLANGSSC